MVSSAAVAVVAFSLIVQCYAVSCSTYELSVHRRPGTNICDTARTRATQQHRRLPSDAHAYLTETSITPTHDGKRSTEYIRVYTRSEDVLQDRLAQLCGARTGVATPDNARQSAFADASQAFDSSAQAVRPAAIALDDVQRIAGSGESGNRVDVTFFSDGYLASERPKFIADVTRLVSEISANQTFHTVAPLLNFWAAFVPSNESGVGVGGIPKDTPFGLYRDGTELRGLYYARPEVARAACDSLRDQCDYPVLLGNDPFYGGLGGEFTTVTPSEVNGALVLRHELGHSVINVGEEYDGGFAYFGPNAGLDASKSVPWAQWLSTKDEHPRVERSIMPFQAYPWTLLNASSPWETTFHSSGTYARHLVRFSLSGVPEKTDLSVIFDGEDLGWAPKPGLGVDRWHYDIYRNGTLNEGEHDIKFVLREKGREGIAQLCSVEILEFGTDEEFNSTPGYYGLFPTYSFQNETTYRPTNEDCLMRITASPHLCSACIEGLWLSLLSRVDLIEDLSTQCTRDIFGATRSLNVSLVPLGQFREDDRPAGESYSIAWTKNGRVLEPFAGQTVIILDADEEGEFDVAVKLITEEVRVDPHGLLESRRSLTISGSCAESASNAI